jgi:hypothetical protein
MGIWSHSSGKGQNTNVNTIFKTKNYGCHPKQCLGRHGLYNIVKI